MPKCVVKFKSVYVFKGMQVKLMEVKPNECYQVCRNSDVKMVGCGKNIFWGQYLMFFLDIRFCLWLEAGVQAGYILGMAMQDQSSAFTKRPQIKSVYSCGN